MMWERPWKYSEGIAIGLGLVCIGQALQATVGKINWGMAEWPVNAILLALFVLIIVALHLLRRKVYMAQYLSSYPAAICSSAFAVAMTVVMGLCRQIPSSHPVDGVIGLVGLQQMLCAWHFVLVYIWVSLVLGLSILRVISQGGLLRRIPFILNHFGLFLVITAGTLGSADMQRLKMVVYLGQPEWRAVESENASAEHELPLAIQLNSFTLEEYDSGQPKRFASDVAVFVKDGDDSGHVAAEGVIEVNKPMSVDGWKIYQWGYDSMMGKMSQYSIFELVKDPWLPAVYVGIYMMLAGAVVMLVKAAIRYARKGRRSKFAVAATLATLAVTAYVFIPIIMDKEVMPALQSPWFAPHVLVYMFAYTMLGAAAIMAIWYLYKASKPEGAVPLAGNGMAVTDTLVYGGLAFMTIGMLFGALWAKEAWGHYWSWDPKETWAAITWFTYLVYIHQRKASKDSIHTPLLMLVVAFVLLQMCWWGINYLPSAQGVSVHTYSQ